MYYSKLAKQIKRYSMLLLSCFMLSNCGAVTSMPKSEHGISPYDYGLREAKTGEERYYALLRTHKTAVNSGNNVEYSELLVWISRSLIMQKVFL